VNLYLLSRVASVNNEDRPRLHIANIAGPELPMMIQVKHMCFRAPYGGRTVCKAKQFAASIADGMSREYWLSYQLSRSSHYRSI
jgi:hypothetical protein